MGELISIIVPVYNVENYLAECIESIIRQTHRNLEIILVDDGSTDQSGSICETYKEKDSRIVVIHKQNEGLSEARNNGMDIAKGEYIAFVDSDDFIHLKMYEFLLQAIKDQDADVSSCGYLAFQDGTKPEDTVGNVNSYSFQKVENRIQYLHNFLSGDFEHYVWKALYKKDFIQKIRFEKGKRVEDIMFSAKMSTYLSKMVVIKDKLYYYRIRNGSIMHNNPEIYLEWIAALEHNIEYFKTCEDSEFVKKYIEFALSAILTLRVECSLRGNWSPKVHKESYKYFCNLYDTYGSSKKSHALGRYVPGVYYMLKKTKVKLYLNKHNGI